MNFAGARLGALWSWIAEARYGCLAWGVVLIAVIISLRLGVSEPVIRLTGLLLQFLGIGTVAWGISETRALFGHPSYTTKVRSWVTRFPLLRRPIVASLSGVESLATVGKLRASCTHRADRDATIDARVAAIEKNIDAIHNRISQTQQEMDAEFAKAAEAIKREEQLRQFEDLAIRETFEATETGGVHISAIGALWLLVGVALSTAAPEIAAALQ